MRICVFLGSSMGVSPAYGAAARDFGALLARRGIGVVYGGGAIGLMGLVADGASKAGGEVIGVIPDALRAREQDHSGLSELHVVANMHERKAMMAELSDAFVALPGGIGTFEELFEVWTWRHLAYHDRPIGLLDAEDYWAPMLQFLRHSVAEGFMGDDQMAMLHTGDDAERLLDTLAAHAGDPGDDNFSRI